MNDYGKLSISRRERNCLIPTSVGLGFRLRKSLRRLAYQSGRCGVVRPKVPSRADAERSGRNGTWYFRREVIEEWWAGKIFGYKQASEFSGYSVESLRRMVERGEISVRKMSWNRVAFDPVKLEVELEEYIRKHWIPARTPL